MLTQDNRGIKSEEESVSVVIPCYNHGRFLAAAIESVLNQTHKDVEVIVVDDGSEDNTKEICTRYEKVKYIYQQNAGLSEARNTGIRNCLSNYLIFLDADDWLLSDAISTNLKYINRDKQLAFVSGAYALMDEKNDRQKIVTGDIDADHYIHFLHGNYIGMIAAVLFRKVVFKDFLFNTTLRACEDYDLYLNIARKYPVLHHNHTIAAYRRHYNNMSYDYANIVATSLQVLRNQKSALNNRHERKVYRQACNFWYKEFFSLNSAIRKKNDDLMKRDLYRYYFYWLRHRFPDWKIGS